MRKSPLPHAPRIYERCRVRAGRGAFWSLIRAGLPVSLAGSGVISVRCPAPPPSGALTAHAAEWAGPGRFFVSRDGSPMRGNAVYQAFVRARTKVGLTGLSFHDLRHTGQTLVAVTGATLADLKRRLGHSSAAVALRYLHAVEGRDQEVTQALSLARGGRRRGEAPAQAQLVMLHVE